MVDICFYFQVHQPFRLRHYTVFDITNKHNYFDEQKNKEIVQKVAKKCYLPMNKLLLDLIKTHNGKFKVAFSITGVALDQFQKYSPEVLQSFKDLAKTGCVEFLSETYYHSLAYLYSKDEFKDQINLHKNKIKQLFNQTPTIFRNTELIYNNELASFIGDLGFKGIIAEGADHLLGWRSPNFLYKPPNADIKVLLKNYKLSDDIAFRFSNQGWEEYPLTVPKYSKWINAVNGNGETINLFMDYETFGEHQWAQTGIFKFMRELPNEIMKNPDNGFITPSEAIEKYKVKGEYDAHLFISWADVERDLSAWKGNKMQESALQDIYLLEKDIKDSKDKKLLNDWRKMLTSDHYYYMCTKWFSDGDVHKYFNPYDTPYDSFISFMNIINDINYRIKLLKPKKKEEILAHP